MIGKTSSGTLIVLLGMYVLYVHSSLPHLPFSLGTFRNKPRVGTSRVSETGTDSGGSQGVVTGRLTGKDTQ